CLQGYSPPWTF
nr:immunoglobulin light chain junction region [Macaca mulatta]MOV78109.1 immunoglobulin light chain junction region [Macaca mulatta]MOV79408.1 immunoglobulin light chain junction region [Macaca mulatta]MOV80226.1 immunoglobulin light chain junction region [Macaca mulatta]MOV81984.1 immunoglobulin light chain junction region [Macaca mulatta]